MGHLFPYNRTVGGMNQHIQNPTTPTMVTPKTSSLIKPADPTPNHRLWLSDPDLLQPTTHSPLVYFYTPNNTTNFFSPQVIKSSLSRVLVHFYPLAGRLCRDDTGRLEIDCNAAGVNLVEAESDSKISDFGDFMPSQKLRDLFPYIDYNTHVGDWPLLLVQLTKFSCSGVCMAVAFSHVVFDSLVFTQFISLWSGIARGSTPDLIKEMVYDRTILRARDPPAAPAFDHEEFKPPHRLMDGDDDRNKETAVAVVKLTREQVNSIRWAADDGKARCSRYEAVAGHLWRCASKARGLRGDQPTNLYITVNGRTRLRPPFPVGYVGNAVFTAAAVASSGDLVSNSVSYSASRIREVMQKVNDEYLRSALDFLNGQTDLTSLRRGFDLMDPDPEVGAYHGSPNLMLTSWVGIRLYDADFGWGQPIHVGPALVGFEGRGFIMPASEGDGSVVVALKLRAEIIKSFMDLVYDYEPARVSQISSRL